MSNNFVNYLQVIYGRGVKIMYRIISALGGDFIKNKLVEAKYDVVGDIDNQENLFKYLNKKIYNILLLSDSLAGFYSKYGLIKKIKAINKKVKIIVILEEKDEKFEQYLLENGIEDFFNNGKFTLEDIISRLNKYEETKNSQKIFLKSDSKVEEKEENYLVTLNSQNIFAIFGNSGCGKSAFSYLYSKYLGEVSNLKILVIDFDTEKGDINLFFQLPSKPKDVEYELPEDKNSALNYLVDMIDKNVFAEYNFEKCLLTKQEVLNVEVITGNKSLNICLNTLMPMYYEKILEMAKLKFDVIFLDVSSSLFLDSTQFAVCSATDIFFVIEPNMLSIERAKRTLSDICENWNIDKKKIKILVNKYKKYSLEKELIKELLKDYEVISFIPYSEEIEEILNMRNSNIPKSIKEEFEFLSSDMGLIRKIKFMDRLFLK